MRVLAAQDGLDLDDVALPVQRFQVVGRRQQVDLGGQLVGCVAPVGVGEQGKLAAVHDGLEAILDILEIAGGGVAPGRDALLDAGGFGRVGVEGGGDVHPVQGVQVVEVHDVVVHVLLGDHQVAQDVGVGRDGDVQRVFHGPDRGESVHGRAHAAGPLGERPGLTRVAPAQDDLDAAHHRSGAVGIRDHVLVVHVGFDAEVALDPSQGVNHDASRCHISLPPPGCPPRAGPTPRLSNRARSARRSPGIEAGSSSRSSRLVWHRSC